MPLPISASAYSEPRKNLLELLIATSSAAFFMKVEGDSMIEAFIPPKALLLVDRALNASSGDIIIAVLNGEFTVKRFLRTYAGTFLSPANPKYKPIKITDEMDFQVWGVVTSIIIDPKER